MDLSNLVKLEGKERKRKRLGRGIGSGKGGHTVGRGNKGQKARKGTGKPNPGFEGGQVPLYKRLPQIGGFKIHGKIKPAIVNLDAFDNFKAGQEVTPEMLLKAKILKRLPKLGVKVLAKGKLKHKIILKGFSMSEAAKKIIENINA